jgi:hypothetical protein
MPCLVKIIFTKPQKLSFLSLGIQLFTWAPYNHAAIGLNDSNTPPNFVYYEALGDGVTITGKAQLERRDKIMAQFTLELNEQHQRKLSQLCKSFQGTPYDWRAVAGIALHRLGWHGNPLARNENRVFCSEFVYRVLQIVGVVPKSEEPELLDPKRLLRYLEAASIPRDF